MKVEAVRPEKADVRITLTAEEAVRVYEYLTSTSVHGTLRELQGLLWELGYSR